MIKFGNKRINIGLVTTYHPQGSKSINFLFLAQSVYEKVSFESTEERDKMLEALDKFLVDWEDGKAKMGDITTLAEILDKMQGGPVEGGPPEGASIQ